VTFNNVADRAPAWSPDGASLVFERVNADESASAIMVLDLATSQATQVTGYTHLDSAPDWSIKDQLVFSRYQGGGDSDLFTIRPDGSGLKQITDSPVQDVHPSWSPDGNAVAFSRGADATNGHAHVFRVGKNGKKLQQLTFGRTSDFFPSWGPAAPRSLAGPQDLTSAPRG
jgi:TolB protein